MSANSDEETRRQALEVGMDQFIPKPFQIGAFQKIYSDIEAELQAELEIEGEGEVQV